MSRLPRIESLVVDDRFALTWSDLRSYANPRGEPGVRIETDWSDHPVVVARDDDGRPIGVLVLHHEEGRLAYLSIAVAPGCRRRGIGRRLCDAAVAAGYDVAAVIGAPGVSISRAGLAFARAWLAGRHRS